jgi:two-component system, NtrC family, sensor kinase
VQNGVDAIGGEGEVRLSARLLPEERSVEVVVADNGSGISKENLAKVFTPFFTTKKMGKGTGLGLAIAYGVVKMHSGDIAVQSEEGKGTTIRIRLPLGQEERLAEEALPSAAVPGPI